MWSYPSDIAYFLQEEPYFIKIGYAGKEYNSYDELTDIHPEFCLGRKNHGLKVWEITGDLGHYGVTDEHPSKHFHKLISEILLNRLKSKSRNPSREVKVV